MRLIDLETLKRVAKTKGINNIGFAEKDYFQDILLLAISREIPGLVFKGGTALYKTAGLDRFSEDLDFSGKTDKPTLRRIAQYITDFGYETEVSIKDVASGTLITFKTQGFLYQGRPESFARVQMDINNVVVERSPVWSQFFSLYPDIPRFRLQVMSMGELAAEKVRALLVRAKARDAYDLWFLLNNDVVIDQALVDKKLQLYELKLNKNLLNAAMDKCERIWVKELKPLVDEVPEFIKIKRRLKNSLLQDD